MQSLFVRVLSVSALMILLPHVASAATFGFSPSSVQVQAGDTVSVSVVLNSGGQSANAVSGLVSFSSDLLSVSSVSKAGSIVTLWVQEPTYSNSAGTVSFEGVIPNPGYSGSGGRIISITFRATGSGVATLSFLNGSILANDGQGTDIYTGAGNGSVTVNAKASSVPAASEPAPTPVVTPSRTSALTILSSTHPNSSLWYANSDPMFSWSLPSGALEVRTVLSDDPSDTPTVRYAPAIASRSVSNLDDGIYYFALQVRDRDGWGSVVRYKIQIDNTAPAPFSVVVQPATKDGVIEATFEAVDALSGIDKYELLVDGKRVASVSAVDATQPFVVPTTPAGTSTLTVIAYDKAGNSTSAFASFVAVGSIAAADAGSSFVFSFAIPYEQLMSFAWIAVNYLTLILIVGGIIGGVVVAGWYVWHRVHTVRRTLLRHLATTDRVLHAELIEIHKSLEEEVERLKAEGKARELTSEEKRILKRFSKLLEKTSAAMAEQFSHSRR